nr:hypothetical protein [Tanacetum cinerariifolium]
GKPITNFESSIRRNLKLNDEAGISSLQDAKLFKNLTLMGYNISPNQKFSIQKGRTVPLFESMLVTMGEGSRTLTEPHHTPSPEDRANITKTLTLPHDSPPRVTSIAADEGCMQHKLNELTDLYTRLQRQQTEMASKITAQDLEISTLKARIKLLEDRDGGGDDPSKEDATIKGRSLETEEEACIERSTDKGSNDTKEMVATVSIPPAGEIPTVSVPTGSGVVHIVSPIFTTATVATPYSRRKGKKKMVESEMPKKKKLQE